MIIDYYMAFFISHVISTRDAHIIPRPEGQRANMGGGLIWHVGKHKLGCMMSEISKIAKLQNCRQITRNIVSAQLQ